MEMAVEGDKVKEVSGWQQNGEQALQVSTLRDFWTLGVPRGQPLLSGGTVQLFPACPALPPAPQSL